MKQAQINHIFSFLIAILLIGALALLGLKSLNGIMHDKCVADTVVFKDHIAQVINNNNDYGSVNYERLSTPCKYAILCLVDASKIQNHQNLGTNNHFPGELIIKDSVKDGVEANVFLIKKDEVNPITYVKNLELKDPTNATCFRLRGGAYNLLLEGQGRTTLVSEKK